MLLAVSNTRKSSPLTYHIGNKIQCGQFQRNRVGNMTLGLKSPAARFGTGWKGWREATGGLGANRPGKTPLTRAVSSGKQDSVSLVLSEEKPGDCVQAGRPEPWFLSGSEKAEDSLGGRGQRGLWKGGASGCSRPFSCLSLAAGGLRPVYPRSCFSLV